MPKYDGNCASRTILFDMAWTACLIFEVEPLIFFDSIEAVMTATFKDEPL